MIKPKEICGLEKALEAVKGLVIEFTVLEAGVLDEAETKNEQRRPTVKKTESTPPDDAEARSERARKGGLTLAAQRGRDYYVEMARRAAEARARKRNEAVR